MSSSAPFSRPFTRPFTRRSLLAAALAGTALVATACTGGDEDRADAVTPAQSDQLARQVAVQASLVAAYEQAFTASPELAAAAAPLADQAREQLTRLRRAAPGAGASGSAAPDGAPPADAAGARGWLRAQVAAAAQAHATACPDFTGARAALLGSIAAGLRGQDGQLA
ncbi:hypothetical protein [Modestobacter sp. NPDC049651]|uniref:hypothetical protein n=1 Tax=unclassified Modestobacter TaxID=2643866 RepID=UPI0033DBE927